MKKRVLKFKRIVVPARVIYKDSIRKITSIKTDFIINGYSIYLDDESKIEKVVINGKHPNSDPETNEFCLSKPFKDSLKISKDSLKSLDKLLSTYNMNDCYFSAWFAFSYDKKFI